jgi:[acyl-carrier-protein] S-malonyltransferase
MGMDLYQAFPEARTIFERADSLLGFSLSRICFEGPEELLNEDLNAQLAMFTLSCAITDVLTHHQITPSATTGYSSGFYAAAYAAGCFDFEYGLRLVKEAGEILLDEGSTFEGAMAVIFGLSREEVHALCAPVAGVDVAISNTPRQTVISGIRSAVETAMEKALAADALDAYPLRVSTAYHSAMMQKSSVRFFDTIDDSRLCTPKIPLLSYSSLEYVRSSLSAKDTMARQLSQPVRWVDAVKTLHHDSAGLCIEVGPGSVIFRTVRWIDRHIDIMTTDTGNNVDKVIERCRTG